MENLGLQITFTTQPSRTMFDLKGNLCGMDAIDLKHELLDYIDRNSQHIELDLRSVKQIDLGGINALAVAYRKLKAGGRTMKILISNEGPVQHLLSLTKMSNFLPLREMVTA